MLLSRGTRDSFKINTIMLAYLSAANKMDIYPTMMLIEGEIPVHFVQEFSLDARIYDRFVTYGSKDEEEFLDHMRSGRFNGFSPSQYDVKFVLDQMGLTHFDTNGHTRNSVIQEVW